MQTQIISTSKVWLVTGASQGLGKAIVTTLLNAGYKVAATSSNIKTLINIFGEISDCFLPLEMNLMK